MRPSGRSAVEGVGKDERDADRGRRLPPNREPEREGTVRYKTLEDGVAALKLGIRWAA